MEGVQIARGAGGEVKGVHGGTFPDFGRREFQGASSVEFAVDDGEGVGIGAHRADGSGQSSGQWLGEKGYLGAYIGGIGPKVAAGGAGDQSGEFRTGADDRRDGRAVRWAESVVASLTAWREGEVNMTFPLAM